MIAARQIKPDWLRASNEKAHRHAGATWTTVTLPLAVSSTLRCALEFDIWFKIEGIRLRATDVDDEEYPDVVIVDVALTGSTLNFGALPAILRNEITEQCRELLLEMDA